MRPTCSAPLLILFFPFLALAGAQPAPAALAASDTKEKIGEARLYLAKGAFTQALASVDTAVSLAATSDERVRSRLDAAALLAQSSGAKDPAVVARVDGLYKEAIAITGSTAAAGKERTLAVRARNNYAAFLLDTGRPDLARTELDAIKTVNGSRQLRHSDVLPAY